MTGTLPGTTGRDRLDESEIQHGRLAPQGRQLNPDGPIGDLLDGPGGKASGRIERPKQCRRGAQTPASGSCVFHHSRHQPEHLFDAIGTTSNTSACPRFVISDQSRSRLDRSPLKRRNISSSSGGIHTRSGYRDKPPVGNAHQPLLGKNAIPMTSPRDHEGNHGWIGDGGIFACPQAPHPRRGRVGKLPP